MRLTTRRLGHAAVLGGLLGLAGCQLGPARPGYTADPLLRDRRPTLGVPAQTPQMMGRTMPAEPPTPEVPPAPPPTQVVSFTKPAGRVLPALAAEPPAPPIAPAAPTAPPVPELVPAAPAFVAPQFVAPPPPPRFEPPPPPSAADAAPRSVPGTYGHAADYTWLQGTLDRHFRGHLDLRYCDPTQEDPHGGKVHLDGDDLLGPCQDGDVVHVEGRLVGGDGHSADPYPHFRVEKVWKLSR
jgi:hypothetical protein